MSKLPNMSEAKQVERKVARAGLGLVFVLAGVVVAASVSNQHRTSGGGDQAIATAVSAADPTPSSDFQPTGGTKPVPRVVVASGDPRLATGFGRLHVGGAQTYANLTVFPVYRINAAASEPGGSMVTLDQAMDNSVVSVVEPSLTVFNKGHAPAYVPGGQVLPGGGQDQGVAQDAVVPPNSQGAAIASFCVEPGRSYGPSDAFHGNAAFAIPAVRYAMSVENDQERVWDAVAEATSHFNAHTETGTYNALLTSSSAHAASLPYETALADVPGAHRPIGMLAAINGKIVCADVYRDPSLFASLWPSLLRSYATQAALSPAPPTPVSVASRDGAAWLDAMDNAPGAQSDGAVGTEQARVATAAGAGVRVASTATGTQLLHEAFWTPAAAVLTNSASSSY